MCCDRVRVHNTLLISAILLKLPYGNKNGEFEISWLLGHCRKNNY